MELTLDFLKEAWLISQADDDAAKRMWDLFAKTRANTHFPEFEKDFGLQMLASRGVLNALDGLDHKPHVLDLGCGAGVYSAWFAERGYAVTAADLSPFCLDKARKLADERGITDIEFAQCDWHNFDIAEQGWINRFDLIFANTTPAVQSYETFRKMLDAGNGWYYMGKPVRRTDAVTDAIMERAGITPVHRPFLLDMLYAYNLVVLEGGSPIVDWKTGYWHGEMDIESAKAYYPDWIATNHGLPKDKRSLIEAAIEQIAQNGVVIADDDVTIQYMIWQGQ